ncbi:hypothetical protein GCM10027290_32500 [Micromonospora sonneratiae]
MVAAVALISRAREVDATPALRQVSGLERSPIGLPLPPSGVTGGMSRRALERGEDRNIFIDKLEDMDLFRKRERLAGKVPWAGPGWADITVRGGRTAYVMARSLFRCGQQAAVRVGHHSRPALTEP